MVIMTLENLLDLHDARKVLGAREIAIIRKQVNGLPLTQSERNRLSRDIRPKFRFIRACRELALGDLELKRGQANRTVVEESLIIIREDPEFPNVLAIIQFGSHVDGTHTWRSDIDIGLLFQGEPTVESGTKILMRLYGTLHDKVDVTIINHLPVRVRATLARNHRVLWARSSFDDDLFVKSTLEELGEHNHRLEGLA